MTSKNLFSDNSAMLEIVISEQIFRVQFRTIIWKLQNGHFWQISIQEFNKRTQLSKRGTNFSIISSK